MLKLLIMATTKTKVDSQIEKRIKEILGHFDLKPQIVIAKEDEVLIVDVKTGNDDLFIARSPDPLLALQHLLRLITKHDFPDQTVSLSLNIGGFHQQQRNHLAEIAKDAAAQVRSTGTAVYLKPMSSFERRLIHLALAEDKDVTSESTGTGSSRRVVVKPSKQ